MNAEKKKGKWSPEEDEKLINYMNNHPPIDEEWNTIAENAGLNRSGQCCRFRWKNHLRPDIKKGPFSPEEKDTVMRLYQKLGNKWTEIAEHLPGRTDDAVKGLWYGTQRKTNKTQEKTNKRKSSKRKSPTRKRQVLSSLTTDTSDSSRKQLLGDRDVDLEERNISSIKEGGMENNNFVSNDKGFDLDLSEPSFDLDFSRSAFDRYSIGDFLKWDD